jgi:hypothetical protein
MFLTPNGKEAFKERLSDAQRLFGIEKHFAN